MEPGHRIEHYVVIEKIGQGGQAAVWSAYDERLKRTVAIKTISLGGFDSSDKSGTAPAGKSGLTTPDRFREEAEIIAALEHPNILPVYAFGQEGDSLYIIMRYMAAGSLKDLLKQGALSLEKAVVLLEPLANALDVAHQNKIIHRDLKSANILLDARLNPYLADFGLSMTIGDKNSLAGVGTLAYMSPEQMLGDPLDPRSDLYAFGILIFEVLTGTLPRVNEQPWNLQQTMTSIPLPVPDSLPPMVADVLRKATALDPADRYNNATEMLADLRAALTPTGHVEERPVTTDPTELALLEAHDLFNRALERWADGAGRFRLEAGDFKYIDSYYQAARDWNIDLSDVARRLMLRAALEHGYNLDTWWEQLTDIADRRAVALQTLTSDLAPARLRAVQRLTTIEDSEPPAIPIRVASIIAAEPDVSVRLAGITLLEKRASPSSEWRYTAHSEVVDGALSQLAAFDPDPRVGEAAARACARLHSASAVTTIARLAAGGDPNALRALTFVRDEVPALPDGVPAALRQRVFVTLSLRQFLADPLSLVWRYLSASLGYGVGLAIIVYAMFNDPNGLLAAQRIGTALAVGALYGVLTGFGVLLASEPAARLRVWTRPGRIALSWIAGTLITAVAFILFERYFYFDSAPNWKWLLAIAFVFVSGFAIASGLTRRTWLRSFAGTASPLIAVYLVSWQIGFFQLGTPPLITLSEFQDDISLILSLALAVAVGVLTFLPEWIRATRRMNQPAA